MTFMLVTLFIYSYEIVNTIFLMQPSLLWILTTWRISGQLYIYSKDLTGTAIKEGYNWRT